MDTDLQGEPNGITINELAYVDTQPCKHHWIPLIRECIILFLLCVNFFVVLQTSIDNQRNLQEKIETKYGCVVAINADDWKALLEGKNAL